MSTQAVHKLELWLQVVFKFSSRHFHFFSLVCYRTHIALASIESRIAIGCNRKHNCIQNLFIEFPVLRIRFACSTFFLLPWITYLDPLASEPSQMLKTKLRWRWRKTWIQMLWYSTFFPIFNYDVAIWMRNNLYPTCLIFDEATKIINQIFKLRMSLRFSFVDNFSSHLNLSSFFLIITLSNKYSHRLKSNIELQTICVNIPFSSHRAM